MADGQQLLAGGGQVASLAVILVGTSPHSWEGSGSSSQSDGCISLGSCNFPCLPSRGYQGGREGAK